jgi:predicted benzoate:H+ symporter BenE
MTLIVTLSMEKHFVTQVVVVAVSIKMIDLHNISIFEVQFTPATFAVNAIIRVALPKIWGTRPD